MKFQELTELVECVYPIRLDAVSELTLNYLLSIAEKTMEEKVQTKMSQDITVLITDQDNIYIGETGDPQWGATLIDQLRQQQDTRVTHLVTWVRSGMDPAAQRMGLDIASYNFRKMLLELNEENAKALFLLHKNCRYRRFRRVKQLFQYRYRVFAYCQNPRPKGAA